MAECAEYETVDKCEKVILQEEQDGSNLFLHTHVESETNEHEASEIAKQSDDLRSSAVLSVPSSSEAEHENSQAPPSDVVVSLPSAGGPAFTSVFPNNNVVILPWGARKEKMPFPLQFNIDTDVKSGEFIMRTLFTEYVMQVEKKVELVMEDLERPLSKSLQRGEDPVFDQLLSAFGSVAEHCLPSLLRTLFAWYEKQIVETNIATEQKQKTENKSKNDSTDRSEKDHLCERRELAIEFVFCLVLIEVLKQLPVHPGHEDLVNYIEKLAFRHFKFREGTQSGINAANNHIVADLYAEVIGVLVQSRFQSVKKKFTTELKDLRSKEPSPSTTQSIISLLMGMKFFRIKMVPIEEFEASFQFMQECAQFFLEVKDKDIKHAFAGLFVEILVPVAATVKNEVNVPVLKNFVEMLYSQTLDMATKKKHCLALFPLVTCLLCVSQKIFFLQNWHYFLAMCLSHLKNRDPKMSRVALESLYRLLWVYMIRIKCESNTATQSRLQSIVNSLFPKGSKAVVPRETPLNIFVKIIQFIAQERLDFAMKEIVFDLISVGRQIKMILTPERMSIGLRAFLVVADSLQQKEGDPPMPRTIGVLPSGNTLRVKKTFLNKMLTEDAAKSIGISTYYPHVRKAFNDILRALDNQFGRPLMMTNVQNVNKELDDMITGERKPKIDLFRTCVAAIPRLIPDGMNQLDLVDLLSRLTVHWDEELRGLAFQSLQNLVLDFPDWREDVVYGFVQFVVKEVNDTFVQLLDNNLRMLLQILSTWKNAINNSHHQNKKELLDVTALTNQRLEPLANVLHCVEGFALVMLCNSRLVPRRIAVHILKEIKLLSKTLGCCKEDEQPVIDVLDKACPAIVDRVLHLLPAAEKAAVLSASSVDLQWLTDRTSSVWVFGYHDNTSEAANKAHASQNLTSSSEVWSLCLSGFLEQTGCATAFAHSWPIVFTRLSSLFTIIDPTPINDNRASLLRSATTIKKPINERDNYLSLWQNYVLFTCHVIPPHVNPIVRCASPDLSLSSSPDSITSDRSTDSRSLNSTHISPTAFYKLIVPLLRSEVPDIRDSVVNGLGWINRDAIKDLMEELVGYIREAIDRKQENMRRRRRRDALRVQLAKLFETIAKTGTFGKSSSVLDGSSLHSTFVEYIDGARLYLESENDKDVPTVQEIKSHFCGFLCELIKSFPLEARSTLLTKALRQNLFYLFAGWSGKFGVPFGFSEKKTVKGETCTDFELQSLNAMSTVVCCGPVFDCQGLSEDGNIYSWLDILLGSHEEKIYQLAQETIVLLLEFNPDMNSLLDWVVDRCYTGTNEVADACFSALATIFSAREYPCDHYTAIINVTLMNTGCPRANIQETALQLLQVLDKRFFGSPVQVDNDLSIGENDSEVAVLKPESNLDAFLSATYSKSRISLSKQLALLHPELTMPMFSEITHRFQTARHPVRQILLHHLLPWLYNMELVDPNIPPVNPLSQFLTKMQEYYISDAPKQPLRREGWGSAEATEMVLNNLFYITAKCGDDHAKEIEELWAALCSCWPNNLKVIIRYLFIVSGMAPNELLFYAKRVVTYLGRARPERLVDEMMNELQSVETLNCLIERTETPPFFRVTSIRKTSSHSDAASNGMQADTASRSDLGVEKGTIHTKRHSGEDPLAKDGVKGSQSGHGSLRSTSSVSSNSSCKTDQFDAKLVSTLAGNEASVLPEVSVEDDNFLVLRRQGEEKSDTPLPHPLPMPEYGGYFAPLTEFLPDSSQPVSGFHRCNLAVMLLADFVLDGVDIDWSIHIPLMLHIIFLGLDHMRPLVYEHCKKLLLNLLIVLSNHSDHLTVAKILLCNKTEQLGYGVNPPGVLCEQHNFTDPGFDIDYAAHINPTPSNVRSKSPSNATAENNGVVTPAIIVPEDQTPQPVNTANASSARVEDVVKSLIDFIASKKSQSLWIYEDITARTWSIRSAEQLETFLRHTLQIFKESQPHAHIEERWAQIALQLALSCSSRHYAGRSLQVFRALRVPISIRMLSDILSRLVETVAEQGEDMQGYVTEIMLTLEAAVDSLDSDFRPIDFVRELFKSTPNLNKDNRKSAPAIPVSQSYHGQTPQPGHTRSTSYSVSYCLRRPTGSPTAEMKDVRARSSTDADSRIKSTNLSRSRSAQSLKMMADQSVQDDKLTILSQLFWIAVSLLESDYEYEFLLAMRLLEKVLKKFPLDRPDCHEKVEKLQQQLKWNNFPGVYALLLKGCTSPMTFEPTLQLLSKFLLFMDLPVIDPTQSLGFPMNVIALLPYMLQNYEDPNPLCIHSAEFIAQVCLEKSKKLENLATVMNLYSRHAFSKESFQWTKCVVKYLSDTYAHLSLNMMIFLVEVLEKGPANTQQSILSIIHCMLHYQDVSTALIQSVNGDLLRTIAKYVEGPYWKEALKILKLMVTRCSSLAAPPLPSHFGETMSIASHTSFAEAEVSFKKELPGRTMDFTFDVNQLQVIGKQYLQQPTNKDSKDESISESKKEPTDSKSSSSPHRSLSFQSSSENGIGAGWKKPWLSQTRTRECLVNLLTSCGQRVGLPKSPSVIFSQTSDFAERQSSMCSSTEEVSVVINEQAGDNKLDDNSGPEQFKAIKVFDFLEYELESLEGETMDMFTWVMRRPSLTNLEGGEQSSLQSSALTGSIANLNSQREESSDDEVGSTSPVDDNQPDLSSGLVYPSSFNERRRRQSSPTSGSSHSICSDQDLCDLTPSNNSPNFTLLMAPYVTAAGDELEEIWRSHVQTVMNESSAYVAARTYRNFARLFRDTRRKFIVLTQECCQYLGMSETLRSVTPQFSAMLENLNSHMECPFVFVDGDTLQNLRLLDKHKFSILELQEHLETYDDKRDHTIECLEVIKSTLKLHPVQEATLDYSIDEQLVEMCRSLYKLHFQLLLLFESYCKLIDLLSTNIKHAQVNDLSCEVTAVRRELINSTMENISAIDACYPNIETAATLPEAEFTLRELVMSKQWNFAVQFLRTNKNHWLTDLNDSSEDEEIDFLLTIYCRHMTDRMTGIVVITKPEHGIADLCNRLMEVNIQLSQAVHQMERLTKSEHERVDCSIRKTEC